jgi:hypothetical protein
MNAASPDVDISNASKVPDRIFFCSNIGIIKSAVPQPGIAPSSVAITGWKGPLLSIQPLNLFSDKWSNNVTRTIPKTIQVPT